MKSRYKLSIVLSLILALSIVASVSADAININLINPLIDGEYLTDYVNLCDEGASNVGIVNINLQHETGVIIDGNFTLFKDGVNVGSVNLIDNTIHDFQGVLADSYVLYIFEQNYVQENVTVTGSINHVCLIQPTATPIPEAENPLTIPGSLNVLDGLGLLPLIGISAVVFVGSKVYKYFR